MPMRIQKISYVVKAKGETYVVTMTKVVGLKLRKPVLVKAKRAK